MHPPLEKFLNCTTSSPYRFVSWNEPQWSDSRTHTPTRRFIDGLSRVGENCFPIFAEITVGCHCPRECSTWTNIFLFSANLGWIPVRLPATHRQNSSERQNDVKKEAEESETLKTRRWRTKHVYLAVRGP